MAAFSDSDEDETFVTLGAPLDIPEADAPRRKPVQVQDIQAKDSKGRPRFHGAFTGGFSAGYFNSVGSQKGFTPSTFVSSREKRAEGNDQQKPEDFMDEEDLGEYGIASRKLVTAGKFSSEERKRRRQDELTVTAADSVIPGEALLLDLIVPERITIGVKLLRKMGWKEGQGVGPRLNRKQKTRQKAGMRVYGCEMPPSPGSEDDDGMDDETLLNNFTYAPGDTTPIHLVVKDNSHGLGYRGLDPRSALPSSHLQLFEPPRIKKTGRKKGIRGQGFGVGALEDEDDDIYGLDDMSNYDMTMGGEEQDANFGWTAPGKRGPAETPVGYVGKVLEGFSLSSNKLVQTKLFPPPQLPRGYRPFHVFPAPEQPQSQQEQVGTDYRQFLRPDTVDQAVPTSPAPEIPSASGSRRSQSQYKDATSRSLALGEQAFVGSVFDLISTEDKERMDASKKGEQPSTSTDTVKTEPLDKVPDSMPPPQTEKASPVEEQRQQNTPLYQGGLGFKPFLKNPSKQERYDRYLALVKQGHKAPYSAVMQDGVTEWEAEREREEFSKASTLYKPLTNMMAARFTTGSQLDDDKADDKADKVEKSEAMKAAEMKMYGQLTRETHEWHPDKLICKRFNVPNPYPGSNIIGLANVKRDKYSVFTFLDFANSAPPSAPPTDQPTDRKQEDSSSKEKETEADKETETKADKELNKFKKMKSIFSHLVEPGKDGDKNKKSGVSFSMKSAKQKQPKEFKSIFSHLDGEETLKKKPVSMETDDEPSASDASKQTSCSDKDKIGEKTDSGEQGKDNKKEKEEEKMETEKDLFRAIFKNTDSEDTSSSESEEEESVSVTRPSVTQVTTAPVAMESVTMATTTAGPPIAASSAPEVLSQPPNDDTQVNHNQPNSVTGQATLPGSGARLETVEDRLAPDRDSSEDSDSYGPALPPTHSQGDGAQPVALTSAVHIDLTKDKSKKHKHKNRHKHKKDKKEKHKKSKHKKKHKKKESKKKRKKQRHSSSDSSDTSDKESDGDDDEDVDTMPSDKELLSRMKMLKPGKRAADFF